MKSKRPRAVRGRNGRCGFVNGFCVVVFWGVLVAWSSSFWGMFGCLVVVVLFWGLLFVSRSVCWFGARWLFIFPGAMTASLVPDVSGAGVSFFQVCMLSLSLLFICVGWGYALANFGFALVWGVVGALFFWRVLFFRGWGIWFVHSGSVDYVRGWVYVLGWPFGHCVLFSLYSPASPVCFTFLCICHCSDLSDCLSLPSHRVANVCASFVLCVHGAGSFLTATLLAHVACFTLYGCPQSYLHRRALGACFSRSAPGLLGWLYPARFWVCICLRFLRFFVFVAFLCLLILLFFR